MISGNRIIEAGKRTWLRIIPLLLLLFLTGCGDDADLPDTPAPEEESPVYLFFTVATNAPGSSLRADGTSIGPTGGEEGDGREPGNSDEYAVSNLRIYLIPLPLNPPTSSDPLPSLKSAQVRTLHFGPADLTETGHQPGRFERRYVTNTLRLTDLKEDSYYVLAVANVKDNAAESENLTLGDLLDRIEEGEPRDAQGHFRMSSEKLGKLSGVQTGTEQYPATAELIIERLAARVDYRVDNNFNDELDGTIPGTITIEGATLVNRFTKGTYLFKRMSDNDPEATEESNYTYLGDETETNWVVDAYPAADKSSADFENYYPHLTRESLNSLKSPIPLNPLQGEEKWFRVGYPLENTNRITRKEDLYKLATGVVFKASFRPKQVTDQTGTAVEHPKGTTFYRHAGKLYKDYAALRALNPGFPATEPSFDELKASYGTDTFVDGICYYTWWIKHNEDGDNNALGPMEYAIVRNNLYQLTVKSVGELGDPEPGPTSLIVEVAVKSWTMLEGEEVSLKPPRVDN